MIRILALLTLCTLSLPAWATNPCLTYDVNFIAGLTLVTATASSNLTVSYY